MPTIISTPNAPAAIGPYCQGVALDSLVFSSGQIAMLPATGNLVEGGIEAQTKQAMENLKAVLEAGASSLDNIVKVTIFMQDLGDFAAMNAVYATYFTNSLPARSCVQVAGLPKGALVEIEAIASK